MRRTVRECRIVRGICSYLAYWIGRQPELKEESMTDWLLFEISEHIPQVKYHTFTRHKEASQTGADWEWWFLFPSFSRRLRVQAKKIHSGKDNYPLIAKTNRYGLQIDKLLKDATKINYLPIYAFYTGLAARKRCEPKLSTERHGVYIAEAENIHNDFILNGKKRVQATDILQRSNPLSCLFCCPDSLQGDGSVLKEGLFSECRFAEYINHTSDYSKLGYYEQIPKHINIFISEEITPEWWEGEFQHKFENVNRLLVFDSRSKP